MAIRYCHDIQIEGDLSVVKGIRPRFFAESSLTLTPNVSLQDTYSWQYPPAGSRSMVLQNPLGSAFDGQEFTIRIETLEPRALTFGTAYVNTSGNRRPYYTAGSQQSDVLKFIFNEVSDKWVLYLQSQGDDKPRIKFTTDLVITPDLQVANHYIINYPSAGTIVINQPLNGFYDADILTLRIRTAAPQQITFSQDIITASTLTRPTTTTGGGSSDYYTLYYDLNDGNWTLISKSQSEPVAPSPVTSTQVTVDLGTKPRQSGNFQIAAVGLTPGAHLIINQIGGPGSSADDVEWDSVSASCIVNTPTLAQCHWHSSGLVKGQKRFIYIST